MEKIIWILGVMCPIQDIQGSLPSLFEVKSRTRWCLGEGAHCPVNLPFKFSSCCKPYVCTVIPKTHKPTWLLKFTVYKDHRCMLPVTNVQSATTHEPILQYNTVSATASHLQEHEETTTKVVHEDNTNGEITTLQFNTNETFANASYTDSREYEEDYASSFIASNETYSVSNEKSNSHRKRRSMTDNSSENLHTFREAEDYNNNKTLESDTSSLEDSNFTSSAESEESVLNSETSNLPENSYDVNTTIEQTNSSSKYSDNNTGFSNYSENYTSADSYFENNTSLRTTYSQKEFVNSSEEAEEEWSSSQMTYDTRPGLHKVVTIHPFRLFQSVELIKINESIETSD